MKLLLLNPPHPAIGSRIPVEHLPPLGLLALGGPLLDAGHQVRLLDAEFGPLTTPTIVAEVRWQAPHAVLIGHSGSTSGHPSAMEITRAIRRACPHTWIVYGGVFPTYHWREIMAAEPQIDIIVRGEGEVTAPRVIQALESGTSLDAIPGIVFRRPIGRGVGGPLPAEAGSSGGIQATGRASLITDLDAFRIGWELIDLARYSYWGNRRAVVVQFSRGCPHRCNYCGQRGFWTRWRHRDPVKFARELAWLHRAHGVEVINFADEDPTASRPAWRAFLEALIAEQVPLILVGSTRADDIVRDADILHLYKQAGVARFLLGLESTNETTLKRIRKDSRRETDREAIRLLRQHGILSMAAYVAGFEEETDRDYWQALRQIVAYDPDQIQALYVTPHRWTPYFRTASERRVIQTDLSRWDYKHQVLATRRMPPWRILIWMKLIEAVAQLRPRSLWRYLAHPDRSLRAAMRWYYRIGRQVWPYEVWHFLFRDRRRQRGPTLAQFLGQPQDGEAEALDPRGVPAGWSPRPAAVHVPGKVRARNRPPPLTPTVPQAFCIVRPPASWMCYAGAMKTLLIVLLVGLWVGLAWGAEAVPPRQEHRQLSDGRLFIPAGDQPDVRGRFDLTLHLHGAPGVVETNFLAAQCRGVLVNVTLPGLSAVYADRFRDTNTFWRILREAEAAYGVSAGPSPGVQRVTVTSFSAGFGGVRELLKHPPIFDRIDALVMADSIYAGFVGDADDRQVSPAQMEGFLEFARAAVAGRKWLLITHSQLRTPTYASTAETADYLIGRLGGRRQSTGEEWPGGLSLLSRFRQGQCEILGFAGDTGEHHLQHLRQLGGFLARLNAPIRPRQDSVTPATNGGNADRPMRSAAQ